MDSASSSSSPNSMVSAGDRHLHRTPQVPEDTGVIQDLIVRDEAARRNSVRKRACKPKVRTGCITCKYDTNAPVPWYRANLMHHHRVRRVKCDEAKPECRRCMVFGVKCDGYITLPTPSQLDNARSLLPRSSQDSLDLQRVSENNLFQTEREHVYFRMFQDDIASGLSGTLEASIWNHLMLQACHDEPFVRNAVVAISALSTSNNLAVGSSTELIAQHKEFALRQYEMAIRTMRVTLSRSQEASPRKALIACLLVCCFESLSGHYFNTLGHAKSGNQLLRDWLIQFSPHERRMDGISSPAPTIIEDDLIRAFSRLDHQVVTFFDSRPKEIHAELADYGSQTINNMPAIFTSVNEASQYLVLIQSRKCHFIYSASKAFLVDKSPEADSSPPTPEPSNFFLEKRKYTLEFLRWTAAFEPLYYQLRDSRDPQLRFAVNVLHSHCKISSVTLNSTPDPNSCSFDRHLSDFRSVIAICRSMVDEFYRPGAKRQTPYFVMDHGLIPVLHTVNLFCRDRRIRRESISLLRQMACREGVWDSLMMAEMDERLMEVEEDGVDTYYIPAKARVTKLNVRIGSDDRKASLECIKGSEKGETLQFRPGRVEIKRDESVESEPESEEARMELEEVGAESEELSQWGFL